MALLSDESVRLAHLLRRTGFGVTPDEWGAYRQMGLAAATERVLHPETVPDHLKEIIAQIGDDFVDFDNIDSVRQLWMYRMAHTRRPLEEKMTLFWHGHFATAQYKVNNPRWMWEQNQTFRELGLGSFRTLLQAVTRDPAMLVWLDGAQNRNGAPNENYAREMMELFTMGAGSGYTEADVQEAARSFTGWTLGNGVAAFVPFMHDDGGKTVLGQTGNYYPDDIVDIVCANPATARFLSNRLWRFFIHDSPTPTDIAKIEAVYFESGYNIRDIVEAIVKSPAFYSEAALYARVKSPIEFTVGQIRLLGAPLTAVRDLYRNLAEMGQDMFNPPNVKGWPDGTAWINARTLLSRVGLARQMTQAMGRRTNLAERFAPLLDNDLPTPEAAAGAVWEMVMPGLPLPAPVRASLVARLREGVPDDAKDLKAAMKFDEKLPSLVEIAVSAPEYQLA